MNTKIVIFAIVGLVAIVALCVYEVVKEIKEDDNYGK